MSAWIGANRYLTQAEMEINATYIYQFLITKGWTINAIAGMLGNMQSESHINPQIWQGLDSNHAEPWGYGLVQWTPSTKLSEWAAGLSLDHTQMDTQLERIIYEKDHALQWGTTSTYPIGFDQFVISTLDSSYLAMAFLYNYERPRIQYQPIRGQQGAAWFNYLGGTPPAPIPYVPKHRHKTLPVYMYS